jgi:hypothetical protein
MIPTYLGIMLIIAAVIIAALYARMMLIATDVFLKQHEKISKELKKYKEFKEKHNNFKV